MKIGIDIDEIIVEFAKGYLGLYNKKHSRNIKFEDLFTYSLWKPLGISKKEAFELAEEYYSSHLFDNLELVEGAEEGIKELNVDHKLVFITSRPDHIKEKTEVFFKKIFPNLNLEVVYSSNSYLETNGKTKSEICKNQGVDVLIEDDIDYALDCADNGIRLILLDKPWNKKEEHSNIIRVKNWNEILKEINKIQRKDNKIVGKIKQFIEEECKKPTSKYGYDPYESHFIPVVKYSKLIAEKLNVDLEIVELAAWLHDIGSIIDGRENHHLTGSEIAEQKLRELNYPEGRIEQIKHCILAHRGSKNIKRETIEAQILADADVMSHFDNVGGIFKAAFIYENHTQKSAQEAVKNKLINSYNKLSPEAKKIIQPKFEAAMLLFGENEQ